MLFLIKSFAFIASILLIFLLVGKLFYHVFQFDFHKKATSFFRNLIELSTSTISITVIYSLYKSNGMTVQMLLLCLILFAVVLYKPRLSFNFNLKLSFTDCKKFFSRYSFLLLLITPVFIIHFLSAYDLESGIKLSHPDYLHYARQINILKATGHENSLMSLNLLYPDITLGISPYHYFELWLSALLDVCFQNPLLTLHTTVYPLLSFLFFLGGLAIIEKYNKVKSYFVVLTYLVLIIGTSYYHTFNLLSDFTQQTAFYFQTTAFSCCGKKLLPLYLFSTLALNFYIRQHYKAALIVMLCLPVINISQLPAAIGIYFLILIYLTIRNGSIKQLKKEYIIGLSFSLILVGSIIWLKPMIVELYGTKKSLLKDLNHDNIIFLSKHLIKRIITATIIYLPYIAGTLIALGGLYKFNKEAYRNLLNLLLIMLCLFIPALLFTEISNFHYNSSQFFSNSLVLTNSYLGLIFLVMLVELFSKKRLVFVVSLLFFAIPLAASGKVYFEQCTKTSSLTDQYSKFYLSETQQEMTLYAKSELIGYFINKEEQASIYPFNSFILIPGTNLMLNGYTNFVFLNNPYKLPYFSKNRRQDEVVEAAIGELYCFMEKQKQDAEFRSYEKSLFGFIKKNKIKIIICSEGAVLPKSMDNIPKTTIQDKKSGETIYILESQ